MNARALRRGGAALALAPWLLAASCPGQAGERKVTVTGTLRGGGETQTVTLVSRPGHDAEHPRVVAVETPQLLSVDRLELAIQRSGGARAEGYVLAAHLAQVQAAGGAGLFGGAGGAGDAGWHLRHGPRLALTSFYWFEGQGEPGASFALPGASAGQFPGAAWLARLETDDASRLFVPWADARTVPLPECLLDVRSGPRCGREDYLALGAGEPACTQEAADAGDCTVGAPEVALAWISVCTTGERRCFDMRTLSRLLFVVFEGAVRQLVRGNPSLSLGGSGGDGDLALRFVPRVVRHGLEVTEFPPLRGPGFVFEATLNAPVSSIHVAIPVWLLFENVVNTGTTPATVSYEVRIDPFGLEEGDEPASLDAVRVDVTTPLGFVSEGVAATVRDCLLWNLSQGARADCPPAHDQARQRAEARARAGRCRMPENTSAPATLPVCETRAQPAPIPQVFVLLLRGMIDRDLDRLRAGRGAVPEGAEVIALPELLDEGVVDTRVMPEPGTRIRLHLLE